MKKSTEDLQKSTLYCRNPLSQKISFFVNICFISKCCNRHIAFFCRFCPCNFPIFPSLINCMKIFRKWFRRSPKFYASGFCCCYSFCLPLAIFDLSFSATKESTCNTISLRNVPIKSFPHRVSNNGISKTIISILFSFVRYLHCFIISS